MCMTVCFSTTALHYIDRTELDIYALRDKNNFEQINHGFQ